MTLTHARANLAATLDRVVDNAEEVVITSPRRAPVVLVSLHEYEAMKETMYLLKSPANAERLRRAITDLDAGRGQKHELIEGGE